MMSNTRIIVIIISSALLLLTQQQPYVHGFINQLPYQSRRHVSSSSSSSSISSEPVNYPGGGTTETVGDVVKPSMESRSTQASMMNPESRGSMRIPNPEVRVPRTSGSSEPAYRDDEFRLEPRFNTGMRPSERELEERLARLERLDQELKDRLNNLQRLNGSRRNAVGPSQRRPALRTLDNNYRDYRRVAPGSRRPAYRATDYNRDMQSIDAIWESAMPITVQGGSLRTWSYANPAVRRVYVLLKTDGRPLNADVELWQGPDNTPHKMKVYVEDGGKRTFSAFLDTPRSPNTICIKNSGHLEFPMYACVGPDTGVGEACMEATEVIRPEVIQGGALRTYPFEPNVDSVAVVIKTDGRPLNARIELLQGPNNNKQIIELYTEDGLDRPFMAVIQTPGSGNVVRVVNSAPIEFPMYATVAPFELLGEDAYYNDGIQIGQEW